MEVLKNDMFSTSANVSIMSNKNESIDFNDEKRTFTNVAILHYYHLEFQSVSTTL